MPRSARFPFLTVAAVLGLAGIAGCATTSFESTWRSPSARPVRLAGQKVAAVFMSPNPTTRRVAEDALAAEMSKRGATGVASYTLLGEENPSDSEAARKLLVDAGVAGMVTMRVVGTEEQEMFVPGRWSTVPVYATWPRYWSHGWTEVYEPGYLQTDTLVSVETLVYSFVQDELLWGGMSQTINPSRADELVRELGRKVANELEDEGLLTR
jgi:hypothetical protein